MKKLNIPYIIIAISVLFSSCEKGLDNITVDSTVYLTQYGEVEKSVLLGESIIELGVYRAGVNQPEGDINVTLGVDKDTLTNFLAANPGFQLLPENFFSLPENNITIPENKEIGYFPIKMKNIGEDFSGMKYVLPISIESVSSDVDIKEDQKVVFLEFSDFRNVYETAYYAYGTVVSSGGDSTLVDEELMATTINANTIEVNGPEMGMYLRLTINDGIVTIKGGTNSGSYGIANTTGSQSTYTGEYNPTYDSNQGIFMLYYTYTYSGKRKNATVQLKFWQ